MSFSLSFSLTLYFFLSYSLFLSLLHSVSLPLSLTLSLSLYLTLSLSLSLCVSLTLSPFVSFPTFFLSHLFLFICYFIFFSTIPSHFVSDFLSPKLILTISVSMGRTTVSSNFILVTVIILYTTMNSFNLYVYIDKKKNSN